MISAWINPYNEKVRAIYVQFYLYLILTLEFSLLCLLSRCVRASSFVLDLFILLPFAQYSFLLLLILHTVFFSLSIVFGAFFPRLIQFHFHCSFWFIQSVLAVLKTFAIFYYQHSIEEGGHFWQNSLSIFHQFLWQYANESKKSI